MPEGIEAFSAVVSAINGGSLDALELAVVDILAADGHIAGVPGIFHGQESCNDPAASRTSVSFARFGFGELDCQYRQG